MKLLILIILLVFTSCASIKIDKPFIAQEIYSSVGNDVFSANPVVIHNFRSLTNSSTFTAELDSSICNVGDTVRIIIRRKFLTEYTYFQK
jgi:hypothetical protein